MRSKLGAFRRRSAVFASLVVAAATVSGLPASATAQPSAAAGAPAPAGTPAPSTVDLHGVDPVPHTVTLLTGDRVTLSPVAGRYGVHVQPAPRQGAAPPVILQQSTPDGLYVLPGDTLAAVQSGRLDRELFNVTYLVENGYADEDSAQVPVIVQYPRTRGAAAVHTAADALPASTATVRLDSIHGAAVGVAKKQAGQFWASVRGTQTGQGQFGASSLGAGVARVWLDRRAHVTLDESVPLIGAPQAWAAGYDGTGVTVGIVDTGVDFTHPDLAGKVVDSRSFLDGVPTAADDQGHGTHVASTITGTGAASGGKYKGVAPGVRLVVAKVCDNRGQCPDSAMIAGMQLAAASGAKVVNMSIGGDATDGTDPISQAVDDLTAQTGTLFVVAAGNSGPSAETVASPGAADAALTVAATDKSDQLASFSSRGPRLDGALKPDIAAPGVHIVAARAAGTTLDPGGIVDDHYIAASGTSMATPHVTGSVAVLAQEHPDWAAAQLKAALMSTSRDVGLNVYERGAGRVDVAHAVDAQVVATTPNADFGLVSDPAAPPSTRDVSYRNLSDRDVTLTLTAALAGNGGAADGSLHVDPTLAVPAHGTATATVTLDPAGLPLGRYTGAVTATADGVSLTTPVGLDHEAPRFTLTVNTIGRDGRPITPVLQDTLDVTGPLGFLTDTVLTDPNTTVTRVPAGKVSVAVFATWVDEDSRDNLGYLLDPEVDVTGDTEITLDLRTASQVTFDTNPPAQPINNNFDAYYQRNTAAGDPFVDHVAFILPIGAAGRLWATPTRPVTTGTFRFATQWTLGKAEVDLSVVKPDRQALHAVETQHWALGGQQTIEGGWDDYRYFTGTQDLPVVDVGRGDPEDLAGRDLHGRLVLAEAGTVSTLFGAQCAVSIERIGAMRDAGAAGIVFYPGADSGCPIPMTVRQEPFTGPLKPIGIPFTFVSTKEGLALRDQITREPVTLRVTGTPETPYSYALKPYEEGRVPDSLHYAFGDDQLAQVDLDIHAPVPTPMMEDHQMWKQDDEAIANFGTTLAAVGAAYTAPRSRHEWIGPLDPTVVHSRVLATTDPSVGRGIPSEALAVHDRPDRLREQWFTGPVTPGPVIYPHAVFSPPAGLGRNLGAICVMCRSGDWLTSFMTMTNGSGEHRWNDQVSAWRLFTVHFDKDGVPVPLVPGGEFFRLFQVDDQPGTYHLGITSPPDPWTPQTDARWTWTAGPVEEDNWQGSYVCFSHDPGHPEQCHPEPLVWVSYDMTDSLAMDNTVPAGQPHHFTVEAYHSPSRAAMPAIAGLKLWASTDDGATWVPVDVRRDHGGTYTATATYPAYDRTKGAVSLKVEAWDTAGNRIEQTTMRAFGLRDRTGAPATAR